MSEGRGFSLPAEPPKAPGLPSNFFPLVFEEFQTLNTKPPRPAIGDGECFWLHGFMPIGPSNLRALWGKGPVLVSASAMNRIVWFSFGNIADVRYCFYLLHDGSLNFWNITTPGGGNILHAGTILNPRTVFGFSQWGSQYVIFASDQENGYWLWDGASAFGPGSLAPNVNVTNSGKNYTSTPSWTLQTTGSGTGVTFSTTIDAEAVSLVKVTSPGSGFAVDDFAIITSTGGGSDTQARATAALSAGGGVTGVVVTVPGSSYTFATTLSFSGGGGSGATAVANIQNGQIVGVTIINPGAGYTSPPTITATDPGYGSGAAHIGGGSGAAGYVTVGSNGISGISIANGGTGYTSVPVVVIVGDGTGAQAVAHVAGGAVTDIAVTNPGQGYTVALAKVQGGNNAANADVFLMPFGISGTTVEVYQQHVWVGNGAAVATFPPKTRVIFSDPENPAGFGNGGGAFLATDSFVRVGYHSLKQSNGFLYLIADSSVNYVSGVSTSSTPATATTPAGPPITTFGNQNVDPQLGSPWPSSVQVFSRNIVFANSLGIFISYGGAVTKISEPLDGFYGSRPEIFVSGADFSSAVANIFSIPVYMLLLPIIDPTTGGPANVLLMWTGKKWFTCVPDIDLSYIATQEIDSALTAWGTDGTEIVPLFAQPSTGVSKVVLSKLFSAPAYWTTKTALRLHVVTKSYAVDEPLNVFVDSEKGRGAGTAAQVVSPTSTSQEAEVLGPYPIAQQGRMIGLTMQTVASDLAVVSISLSTQIFEANQ